VFGWSKPLAIDLLLFPAAGFMIARLVHAEALPGDRQFWITRPYRWQSLLGAKLLFMLAFVNLPIMLAQWLIVAMGRFPLASYLPGLLFTQVLMIFGVSLPIAALAAITRGLTSFAFCVLTLVAIWFTFAFQGVRHIERILPGWPPGFGWIRATVVGLGLAAIIVSILYLQYRSRKTFVSRAIGVAGLALLIAVALYLPWKAGWAVQTRLSKRAIDDSLIQISTDPAAVRFQPVKNRTWSNVDVDIPIAAGPMPDGMHLQTDILDIRFQAADGAIWKSEIGSVRRRADKAGQMTLDVATKVSNGFFNQQRDKLVTIRGSLYMTLFGDARQATIPVRAEPVNALDGLQCYLGPFDQFYCRSAFRWPGELVYAKFGGETSPVRAMVSYDPFPGSLRLNPIETNWSPSTPRTPDVTIVVEEPLAHIRRDFEIHGVRVH
jgi:hypothetical protein